MARRIGLGLLLALVLIVSLAGVALALAQTAAGQRFIASRLEAALSSPEAPAEVEGLHGTFPSDVQLERLALVDADGPWLVLEDVRLDWSLPAVLRGQLRIREISARRVALLRLPPGEPEPEGEPGEPLRLPELPDSLPPVTVERLAVEVIEVGEAVLGEPLTLTLDGHLATTAERAELELDLRRTDEESAEVHLAARLDLEPGILELEARAREQGGLLAALSGTPAAGDLTFELGGRGPLDDWSGTLALDAEGLAAADLDLTLALTGTPRLRLDGEVTLAPGLIPDDLRPLAPGPLSLALALGQPGAQTITLERLQVVNEVLDLHLAGEADLERSRITADGRLEAAELEPLSRLAGVPLGGGLALDLHAEGALDAPRGTLALALADPRVANASADALEAELGYQVRRDRAGSPSVRLTGGASVSGLALEGGPPLPEPDLQLSLRGTFGETAIDFEQLAIEGAHTSLAAHGRLDPSALAGDIELTLTAADLAALGAPYGQAIGGRARLGATVEIMAGAERIGVALEGEAHELDGLPDAAAALIGSEIDLAARVGIEPEREVRIRELSLTAARADLSGTVALGLPDGPLGGELVLDVAALAPLAPLIGEDLAGAGRLTLEPRGTLAAPAVVATLESEDLAIAGRPIERLALRAEASDLLGAPEGELGLALSALGMEGTLAAAYRLDGETLHVDDIRLDAPATTLEGALTLDLARTLLTGRLEGGVTDLLAWRPVLPVRTAGALDLAVELDATDGRQAVDLDLALEGFESPFATARRLALEASITDALGTPAIEATLALSAVRQDDLRLARGEITAEGGLESLTVRATLEGEAMQPFDLEATAVLALGDATRVRIETLSGTFAEAPFRLLRPAEIALADPAIEVEDLGLELAGGTLDARLRLAETVELEASLEGLPLELLATFGAPELSGTASATLSASGPAAAPEVRLDLSTSGVRLADEAYGELPPLELTADAAIADGRLDASLRASGLTAEPVTAALTVPVTLGLQPFAFALPDDGALDGELAGRLDLARVEDLVDLADQRLEGDLALRLEIAGSLAAPEVSGEITLSDGLYDNGTTGTVLRDIRLEAEARQQAITITRLSATDGAGGRIEGDGELSIDPDANFPYRLELEIRGAELVRRDDARATLGGRLTLAGDATAAALSGRIRVEQAEISIPEGGGPSVPVLDVEEIGGASDGQENGAAGGSPFALTLDLAVEIPGQVFVRGRGLESEWEGRLQVSGRAEAPRIDGNLRIRRGHFDLLDKRFELRRGVITFAGASPPAPTIDLEATAEGRNVTAVVRLTGPATAPELELSSDSGLPEDEVLAQLLFDHSVSEMTASEAASLALAVNRLRGGGGGFDPLGSIRDKLGLDTLEVSGGVDGQRVSAGKYVSDEVFVGVETGTAEDSSKAEVEIELLPNLSLEADVTEEGRSGVGIQWRFDY